MGLKLFGSSVDLSAYAALAGAVFTGDVEGKSFISSGAASDQAFGAYETGDDDFRLSVLDDGSVHWGDGTAPPDARLYRKGAGELRTGGSFYVDNGLIVDFADGASKLWFGSGFDTNLYRNAAGSITTDGDLRLGARLFVDGGSFVLGATNAGSFQTTVGAAGGASALPATPTKYMKIQDSSGTTLIVPCYAAS